MWHSTRLDSCKQGKAISYVADYDSKIPRADLCYRTTVPQAASYEDHLVQYDLVCPITDVIHGSNPCHLVAAFEFLGDTFLFGKLFYQLKIHLICLLINLLQIRVQCPVHSHNVDACRTIFPQVLIVRCPQISTSFKLSFIMQFLLCNFIIVHSCGKQKCAITPQWRDKYVRSAP